MSTACPKPELNRSMKNCINGAIVKIKKKIKKKQQNTKICWKEKPENWKNQHAEACRLKTRVL